MEKVQGKGAKQKVLNVDLFSYNLTLTYLPPHLTQLLPFY